MLIVLLAACGIGFDMAHSIFSSGLPLIGPISISAIFGAMEDVGEMIVMSVCVWYVVALYWKEKEVLVGEKTESIVSSLS